ncbi:MAG: hypothetical protein WCE62_15945 [Polyangiales bacterium]
MRNDVWLAVTVLTAATCSARIAAAEPIAEPGLVSPPSLTIAPFLAGPPRQDGPVVVRASFHLRDVNDIDDEAETVDFEGILTLTWHDARQAFDPTGLGIDEKFYQGAYQFNEVFTGWFPQVILANESGRYEQLGVVLHVTPDGTLTLVQTVNAVAEVDLGLRRYPFDRQRLDASFEVLGGDKEQVVLQVGSQSTEAEVRVPQWKLSGVSASTRDRSAPYAGRPGAVVSTFVVSMDVERQSFFMVRLVVLPLVLIVMLSWSVFWMDRASLGDRVNVSFIGILTAVAYQIVVSEILPNISYMTLMNGFLNLSFVIMCATVVINLVVGIRDARGQSEVGDRIDRLCRWTFPLAYFGSLLVMVGITFIFF